MPISFNTPSANGRRIIYCILHFVFLVIDNAAIKPLSLSSNIATVSREVDPETIESNKIDIIHLQNNCVHL